MENSKPEQGALHQPLQPQSPLQPEQVAKHHSGKKPLFISLAILLVVAGYFLLTRNLKPSFERAEGTIAEVAERIQPSPTPMPFFEMTVPHLRQRDYQSSLGEMELLSQSSSYESYLTSYDSDGYRVNGLLTRPAGDEPEGGWPAIVFVHGYIPPSVYQTTGQYADYVDFLARNGFVVFKIDLRGHGDSEGEAGGGYFGSDYIVDVLNARAALGASDFVNGDKIGLWGHSMAGNVLMRSWAAEPEVPAVVIWAGAVYTYEDRDKYGIDDNSYRPPGDNSTQRQNRRRELFEKHGSPSAQSVFWRQVIPTNYTSDLKGALQIHHAVDDSVVNIGYSRDLMEVLKKTSVPHELFEYSSGGHNISDASFVTAMQRTVDFYKEQLK